MLQMKFDCLVFFASMGPIERGLVLTCFLAAVDMATKSNKGCGEALRKQKASIYKVRPKAASWPTFWTRLLCNFIQQNCWSP